MKNLTDLREHLFETLDLLKAKKISIEEAKTISTVAQTLINSAKAEIDFIRLTEGKVTGSSFLQIGKKDND